MEGIMKLYEWIMVNKNDLLNMAVYLIAIGSVVVKLVPTLDKNNRWLPFVKFIGKYIALDKGTIPNEDRPNG